MMQKTELGFLHPQAQHKGYNENSWFKVTLMFMRAVR